MRIYRDFTPHISEVSLVILQFIEAWGVVVIKALRY
jgi:hypothetical protein